MKTKVLEVLNDLHRHKQEQHIAPDYVSYVELTKNIMNKVRLSLNELYKDNKIKVHQGLNDKLIEVL